MEFDLMDLSSHCTKFVFKYSYPIKNMASVFIIASE